MSWKRNMSQKVEDNQDKVRIPVWLLKRNTRTSKNIKNPTVLALNGHYSISKNCEEVQKVCFPICIWHIRITLKRVFTLRVTQILLKCLPVCLSVRVRLRSMLSHFHMSAHWSHMRIDISREAAPLHSSWSRTPIYFHLCCNYKSWFTRRKLNPQRK